MKNREIKFKAWHIANKIMAEVGDLNWTGKIHVSYKQGEEKSGHFFGGNNVGSDWEKHEYILMQFTGCKDCNGIEIYEGDIVECKDGTIGEVAFSQQAGCWWIKWKAKVNHYKELTDSAQTGDGTDLILEGNEIVGNVYQNPIFKANW